MCRCRRRGRGRSPRCRTTTWWLEGGGCWSVGGERASLGVTQVAGRKLRVASCTGWLRGVVAVGDGLNQQGAVSLVPRVSEIPITEYKHGEKRTEETEERTGSEEEQVKSGMGYPWTIRVACPQPNITSYGRTAVERCAISIFPISRSSRNALKGCSLRDNVTVFQGASALDRWAMLWLITDHIVISTRISLARRRETASSEVLSKLYIKCIHDNLLCHH